MVSLQWCSLDNDLRSCFRDSLVLFAHATADPDRADHRAVALNGDTTGEDHDLAVVGGVDAVEILSRLRELAEGLGLDIERAAGPRFFLRDVDASHPRAVHAGEGDEIAAD